MVTFPSSASTKIVRSDWRNIRVCRRYNPFKVSFPNTLPAATGVVPEEMLLVCLKYRFLQ
jgi:hypothetical protein